MTRCSCTAQRHAMRRAVVLVAMLVIVTTFLRPVFAQRDGPPMKEPPRYGGNVTV